MTFYLTHWLQVFRPSSMFMMSLLPATHASKNSRESKVVNKILSQLRKKYRICFIKYGCVVLIRIDQDKDRGIMIKN